MEYKRIDIPVDTQKDWFNIYPISDVHIGNACHNPRALTAKIKEIKEDPLGRWIGVGDLADLIFYSDPRFHVISLDSKMTLDDLKNALGKTIRDIVSKFEPIADKCLGVMTGNHEEKASQKYHIDVTAEIADRLKVNYLGYSCLLYLKLGVGNHGFGVRLYANHGFGGGKRHGSQINKVEDLIRVAEADIYLMGHVHGKAVSQLQTHRITTTGRPTKATKTFVITSSMQEASRPGSISYAERMGMPQAPLGSPVISIGHKNDNHELEVKVKI